MVVMVKVLMNGKDTISISLDFAGDCISVTHFHYVTVFNFKTLAWQTSRLFWRVKSAIDWSLGFVLATGSNSRAEVGCDTQCADWGFFGSNVGVKVLIHTSNIGWGIC